MPQLNRVIFLDVDGVLHPFPLLGQDAPQDNEAMECLKESCMLQLSRIVRITGASIVLSSSWRFFPSTRQRLQDRLMRYGIPPFKRWIAADIKRDVKNRMDLIMEFVGANSELVSDGWVVIDDADLVVNETSLIAEVFKQHFVRTDPVIGLTKDAADKAIAILRENNCSSSSPDE